MYNSSMFCVCPSFNNETTYLLINLIISAHEMRTTIIYTETKYE